MSGVMKFAELFHIVEGATEAYEAAHAEEARASVRATAMLNQLNNAQKTLADAIDDFMDASPGASDWGYKRRGHKSS